MRITHVQSSAQSLTQRKCSQHPHVAADTIDFGCAGRWERKWNIDPFKEFTDRRSHKKPALVH